MLRFIFAILFLALPGTASSSADNWMRWRGPHADGSSDTATPPVRWDKETNIKWQVEIPGSGSSTPIIYEDNVFILSAIPTGRKGTPDVPSATDPRELAQFGAGPRPDQYYQFAVLCYDRQTGAEKWRSVAAEVVPHEAGHSTNTFASSSPVTDGEHLFVSFGSRGIYCFDLNGNMQWKRDLGRMQTRREFGEASSPALQGDTLVVPWDHDGQSYCYALNAKNGDILWQTERDELTTWATPLIVEHRGRYQVITNGTKVRSYDLRTGELIWECGGQVSNPIPCPVAQDGIVYCMTGYRGNAVYAISLDAKGDVTDTAGVIWSRDDAAPYVSSPVLYRNRLWFTKSRSSILSVIDLKTGEAIIDQARINGMSSLYASPVAAADRVYFTSREGVTVVLRNAGQVQVLATNDLGETIDASPAIVDTRMFLRGAKHLFCIVEER